MHQDGKVSSWMKWEPPDSRLCVLKSRTSAEITAFHPRSLFSLGANFPASSNLKAVEEFNVGRINQRTKISSNTISNCFPAFFSLERILVSNLEQSNSRQPNCRHFVEKDNFIETSKWNMTWWVPPNRLKPELHPKLSETGDVLRYVTFLYPQRGS